MANLTKTIVFVLGGVLLGFVLAKTVNGNLGGVYNQVINEFYEGLKAGKSNQFIVDNAGAVTSAGITNTGDVTSTSSGTTTLSLLTTSTTQGFCIEGYATSANTPINITIRASSTDQTDVGLSLRPRYGLCP